MGPARALSRRTHTPEDLYSWAVYRGSNRTLTPQDKRINLPSSFRRARRHGASSGAVTEYCLNHTFNGVLPGQLRQSIAVYTERERKLSGDMHAGQRWRMPSSLFRPEPTRTHGRMPED